MHTAIDAADCRGLAEFYRQWLGLRYRDGDEPPTDGTRDTHDWLVLQMHMDFKVPTVEALERDRRRAEQLGARLLHDRSQDDHEPLYVLADPAGHPFCLLVQ